MVRRTWWLCCMCGSKEWEDDMNFSRVYVWLGRRGGERPPVKRVRCLCVFVGGWPQQAARGLICLCDGWLGTLFYVFDGRRTNEIDIHVPPATRPRLSIQSVLHPHLAHPLPSSTSTNTHRITPSTTSSSTHDGIGHYREIRFVYPSPPRITILLIISAAIIIFTHPNIPTKDRNN